MPKSLFKKAKAPELVRSIRSCLNSLEKEARVEKAQEELNKSLREMKTVLFGEGDTEPNPDIVSALTQEVVRDDFLKALIFNIPRLDLEGRINASRILANLQRQKVDGEQPVVRYLEMSPSIIDFLVSEYQNTEIALISGTILRECFRSRRLASYVLYSKNNLGKFFAYVDVANFDVASDAFATLEELLTRHEETVAQFLIVKYQWFFENFDILLCSQYITKRQAIKLLGKLLSNPMNSPVAAKYVSSAFNLMRIMNLLRESSKAISTEAFNIFRLFITNENKSAEVTTILHSNRNKLLSFFSSFTSEKGDDPRFEEDKAEVLREIRKWPERSASPPPNLPPAPRSASAVV